MNSKQGFTLIEVLLGLMIFSIISLTLYNTFSMGMKIDRKSNDINKSYQEARLAFDLIGHDLENAFIYDFSGSYLDQSSFSGNSNEMSFLVPEDKGVSKVRFSLGVPNWGHVTRTIMEQHTKNLKQETRAAQGNWPIEFLVRQETLLPEYLAKKKQTSDGEIIAAGIKKASLKLQYGALKRDSQGRFLPAKDIEWKNSWKETFMPNAVRVEITLFDQQNPQGGAVLRRDIYLPRMDVDQ